MTRRSARDLPDGRPSPGDDAQFRAALRDNAADLLAYFERRLASRDDAADALGDTMLQAWRRAADQPGDPVEARMWLFTIAGNVRANQQRSGRRRSALTERLGTALATAAPQTGEREFEHVALRDAIGRLPPEHRELVMLVHWDGLSIADAAEVMGLNASTARTRYATARASLREALAEVGV